jgi:hypothetical protein
MLMHQFFLAICIVGGGRLQIAGSLSWDGMTDGCFQSISMIQFTWAGLKVPVAKGCLVIVDTGNTLT